ncbi:MAG: hypothetical protein EOM44_12225 [Bacteroidia bacterium]|nr:hypothetical protein [Bacteroidia bacterium]
MKKVFQIKLKSITKVFAMVIAISLVTFTGCKTYDSDIDQLNTDLVDMKANLGSLKTELTALNNATKAALELQIAGLNTEIATLKGRLTTMEQTGATKAELNALKTEILNKTVSLEAFNAYKATVTAELAALTTQINAAATKVELAALGSRVDAKISEVEAAIAKTKADLAALQAAAATKEELAKTNAKLEALQTELALLTAKVDAAATKVELAALATRLDAKILEVEGTITALGGRVKTLEGGVADLNTGLKHLGTIVDGALERIAKNETAIQNLLNLNSQLGARIAILEGLLKVKNGKSEVLDGIQTKLADQLALINANADEIGKLKTQLSTLSGKVDLIIAEQTAQNNRLKALEDKDLLIDAEIVKVNKRIDDLINVTIKAINDQITDLKGADVTINGRIDALLITIGTIQQDIEDLKKADQKTAEDIIKINEKIDIINETLLGYRTELNNLANADIELGARIDGLDARIKALEDYINGELKEWIEDTDKAIEEIRAQISILNNNMKAIASAIKLNFNILSNRLTSMTYNAFFYINGIPAINFAPLMASCDTITPEVIISYRLNPSFITKADIDTAHMSFSLKKDAKNVITGYANAPAVSQEVKAHFVDIVNGDLLVKVEVAELEALFAEAGINMNWTMLGLEETFPQVLLQVPLSEKAVRENELVFDENGAMTVVLGTEYPADRVISASQWVRMNYTSMKAQWNVYLALDNKPFYTKLKQTVQAAKDLKVQNVDTYTGPTNPTVITVPFEGEFDLNDTVVAVLFANLATPITPFDIEKYGLKFKFDLMAEDGVTPIDYVRNGVNQQNLIDATALADGIVKAKTVAKSVIAQSKGRTPIVRVSMYSDKKPTCAVLFSFVKVVFEEQPAIDLKIDINKVAACTNLDSLLTVQWTNDSILDQVGMTSAEFAAAYTGVATGYGSIIPTTVGTTTVLHYVVPITYVWTLLNATSQPTVTINAKYTYTPADVIVNPIITVNFTMTVARPAAKNIAPADLIAKYWFDMNGKNNGTVFEEVKHNVNIPDVGENTTANNKYKTNITGAFVSNTNKSLKGFNNYQYFFIKGQKIVGGEYDGYAFKVSADGQTLWSSDSTELIATINPFVGNTGDLLVLNQASDIAKKMLNEGVEYLRVKLGIRYNFCPDMQQPTTAAVTVNEKPTFDVVFVRPINISTTTNKAFTDGVLYGQTGSYMTIKDLANLKDWRGEAFSASTNANLYGYYGITSIQVDEAAITTNLNGTKKPLSDYKQLQVAYMATVPGVTPAAQFGYLTYQNNGLVIGNDFDLFVPVTVKHWWGEITSAEVIVKVNKTTYPAPVRRN